MKELTRFLGMVIWMCEDFESSGHVHIQYNQYQCVVGIDNCAIFNGTMPPRILMLASEWILANKDELARGWEMHKKGEKNLPVVRPLVE